MKNFFKRLFCFHEWEEYKFGNDLWRLFDYKLQCQKCGRTSYTNGDRWMVKYKEK
jgi:hypothetical protein